MSDVERGSTPQRKQSLRISDVIVLENNSEIKHHDEVQSQESHSSASNWQLSGCKCSKALILLLVQVAFSMTSLAFSIGKLSNSNITDSEKTLYISIMTATVSTWLPSPLSGQTRRQG